MNIFCVDVNGHTVSFTYTERNGVSVIETINPNRLLLEQAWKCLEDKGWMCSSIERLGPAWHLSMWMEMGEVVS